MVKYDSVKIPGDFAEEVDMLLGKHGFISRAEIVKEALRDLLLKYGVIPQ